MNSTKNVPLIFALLFSLVSFSAQSEETTQAPEAEQIEEATQESLIAESKVILANINQLNQQTAELKEVAKGIPEFDQLLFITLLISIENEIADDQEHLISLQKKLDKSTQEAQLLARQLRVLSIKQERILRYEINTLKNLFPKLREQEKKDASSFISIQRAKQLIFDLLIEWQKNIDRQSLLGMNVAKSIKELSKIVHFVAITQTGRIRISLDAIEDLNLAMESAGPDEQKEITRFLYKEELKKKLAAKNLEEMLGIMTQLEMDTTKFGQALVLATGKILHTDVKTKAVIGLFARLMSQSVFWLQENLPFILFRIFSFCLIILAFKIIASIVRKLIDRATASSRFESSQLLKDFLGSIAQKLVVLIGIIIALSQLGIEIGPLLAGMGIMGFVVGFALQDTLSNFASGLMILVYRPFDIGNMVVVAEITGEVKEMNLVSTTILTIDNKRLIIPNSKVWGDIIINVTAERVRRVDLVFGIGYGDNISEAEKVLQDIVEKHELTLSKPEAVIKVHTLGESSVDFIVRPWVKSQDYWNVYWDITREVKERFDAAGISIPFPQRDIHVFQETKST